MQNEENKNDLFYYINRASLFSTRYKEQQLNSILSIAESCHQGHEQFSDISKGR